ncbi:hypothetical protein HDA30_000393 [Micrococcus cohnii]|uniref:Uncharacterized protein n=1 Tax=Micrococcus cohnii TaxID=993416 RepID=A0A7W7GML1_9MICC|nr:hypothetical protein [Micrococcus cohnii]MBB4734885.1 hypothetical protein [Micrococcus cohnii]
MTDQNARLTEALRGAATHDAAQAERVVEALEGRTPAAPAPDRAPSASARPAAVVVEAGRSQKSPSGRRRVLMRVRETVVPTRTGGAQLLGDAPRPDHR